MRPMLRGDFKAGSRGHKLEVLNGYFEQIAARPLGVVARPPGLLGSMEIKAARAQFMKEPTHFDLMPWLSTFSGAAFLEPRLLTAEGLSEAGVRR